MRLGGQVNGIASGFLRIGFDALLGLRCCKYLEVLSFKHKSKKKKSQVQEKLKDSQVKATKNLLSDFTFV